MDVLYAENYFILSVFLSFFMLEVGIAVISLARYGQYLKKLRNYLLPIWAIDGTFAVFYLVNLEASYPNLINTIGYAYVAPILLAGMFLILRNAFLAYSELARIAVNERRFVKIYAISTLAIAVIVIYALSSSVAGFGINILSKQLEMPALLTSGFNVLILISVLVLSVSSALLYFGISSYRRSAIAGMMFALVLVVFTLLQYDPWMIANLLGNIYVLAIVLLAMTVTGALALKQSAYVKYAVIITLVVSVNLFGAIQYPYTFGTASIVSYENGQPMASYIVAFTTVGIAIVALSLAYLFYLGHKTKRTKLALHKLVK